MVVVVLVVVVVGVVVVVDVLVDVELEEVLLVLEDVLGVVGGGVVC